MEEPNRQTAVSGHAETQAPAALPPPSGVPAVIPVIPDEVPRPRRRWWLIFVLAGAIGGGWYWWSHRPVPLPPWIAASNGRLEADEVDIDTKFPGRVAEIDADEGSMVTQGQVVARMDTRDLAASLAQAESMIDQTQHTATSLRADIRQQATQIKFAAQQLQRTRALLPSGYATREELDLRQAAFDAAVSAYNSDQEKLNAAIAAQRAAEHNAELIRVNINDSTLIAPKHGPIQYRLSNVGEVLPAGGKVFTMLDIDYVYMDVFLPTAQAGRVFIGAPARIVLDAWPDVAIPASVVFAAAQNQFTPKTVETKEERDKLMFRIRVRISRTLLEQHAAQVRSGLPGMAYVLLDPRKPWPAFLQTKLAS